MRLNSGVLVASPTSTVTSVSLARLEDRVYYVLRDSDRDFITKTMVDEWLNEGYLDLCARLKIPQKQTTGTTTSTGTIALPADFIAPVHLAIGDNIPVWVATGVFESWRVPSVEPETIMAQVFNNIIETYPTGNTVSKAYTLRYTFTPAELVNATDTPVSLPKEMVPRLIDYARAHVLWTGGDVPEGDRYFARYSAGLPDAPRLAERMRPGPSGLTPGPSTFEE